MNDIDRQLPLAAFDKGDYSVAKPLTMDSRITHPDEINRALSLYFQWPDYRACFLGVPGLGSPLACDLDYDRDSRIAEELHAYVRGGQLPSHLAIGSIVTLILEMFGTAFECETAVLLTKNNSAGGTPGLFLALPKALLPLRRRKLPRLALRAEQRSRLGPCAWIDPSGTATPIVIQEMGLASVTICAPVLISESGQLCIDGELFPAEVVRRAEAAVMVQLHFDGSGHFGSYFDLYSRAAYPNLHRRSSLSYEDVLQVYKKTGYFTKFEVGEEASERERQLISLWRSIDQGFHHTTADYIGIDGQGRMCGASGLAIAFVSDGTTHWAFHQLCAVTDPSLLELSGALYRWRAEYLASRPEALNAVVWFDSRSRWLERIYVKFCLNKGIDSRLFAVSVWRVPFQAEMSALAHEVAMTSLQIGDSTRHLASRGPILGGLGPHFLNASGILDAVVAVPGDAFNLDILSVGNSLSRSSGGASTVIEVTLPLGQSLAAVGVEPVLDVDRYCKLRKDDLVEFLGSVEHSIAVTARKAAGGRHVP